ncbi:hypothetical protein MATL_G00081680 [Megalops atlanticus]|uniref:RNA/RNP complex-1-interacting phosphatase n=1 Tax=Megalops atlanticus TaxID=7932 RepID=A0A9D3T7S6_MEGAT|nr:hypothetical protein MATL_G00081680 [Megalops atlanticus]
MPPKKKNAIPDRWTDYRAMGRRIPGTRFIAFKVPLKQALMRQLPRSEAFGPWDLVQLLRQEQQELGLIIDLTFTTRYYRPEDLPENVSYVKIYTAGHEVPSDGTILSFKMAVKQFLRENQANDKLIGVHCTHGLNRTGYLVCRYLIDVEGVDPAEAIELFNRSRGHCIERENYLEDLKSGPKRSNRGIDEPEQEPVRDQGVRRPDDAPFNRHPSCDGPFRGAPYPTTLRPVHQRALRSPMQRHPSGPRPPPPLPPYRMGAPRPYHQGQDWRRPPPLPPCPPVLPRYSYGEPWQPPNGHFPPPFPPGPQADFRGPDRKPKYRFHKQERRDWR